MIDIYIMARVKLKKVMAIKAPTAITNAMIGNNG